MAPKKRTRSDEQPISTRVTRSSTTAAKTSAPPPPPPPPQPVRAQKKAKTEVEKPQKKGKTEAEKPQKKGKTEAEKPSVSNPSDASKTVVIEHCKQCNQFKKRAILVKETLESDISGINVLVNPEKPRRGCFEVREEGGDIFISLLDMKRPFTRMRELDMDKVISDIIDKLK